MSSVEFITIAAEDSGLRLDYWFRRWYPTLAHGRLEKLLRTGQVRVDGQRAKAGQRLERGQTVRIPPLSIDPSLHPIGRNRYLANAPTVAETAALRARVLYRDTLILAIDKPAGLSVQGGSGTTRHLDAMLDALRFEAPERPRLVHRLDKDTSGVLLLARTANAAAALAETFRSRAARKIYWAVVTGVPKAATGRLSVPLAKVPGHYGERVAVDENRGKIAVTDYRVIDTAARQATWLELEPYTGRTHQLRVHCALLGTPILGDGKYGGATAFLSGRTISRRLHLHARTLVIPRPGGGFLRITGPLPPHMAATFTFLGFLGSEAWLSQET